VFGLPDVEPYAAAAQIEFYSISNMLVFFKMLSCCFVKFLQN
jgi:hypothetical protein